MLARELVKISNFRHYYFILNKDYIKPENLTYTETKEIAFDYKLKTGKGCGLLSLEENTKNADVDYNRFYDIGYSLQRIAICKLNAENVAKYVDTLCYADTKTKIFKIVRLEQYEGIAFIHLRMNNKEN